MNGSSQSRFRQKHIEPSGVNARMDRLTREMAEVSEATETGDPGRAGQSLGIKRKNIERKRSFRNELRGIEGIPVRKRQKRSSARSISSSQVSASLSDGTSLSQAPQNYPQSWTTRTPPSHRASTHQQDVLSKFGPPSFSSVPPSFHEDYHSSAQHPSLALPRVAEEVESFEPRPTTPFEDRRDHQPLALLPSKSRHIIESLSSSDTLYQGDLNSPTLRPLDIADPIWKNVSKQPNSESSPFAKSFDQSSIFEPNLYTRQFSDSPSPLIAPASSSNHFSQVQPLPSNDYETPPQDQETSQNPVPRFEEAARLRSPSQFMMSKPRSSMPSAAPFSLGLTRTRSEDAGIVSSTPTRSNLWSMQVDSIASVSDSDSAQLWRKPRKPVMRTPSERARKNRLDASKRLFERELSSPTRHEPKSRRSHHSQTTHDSRNLTSFKTPSPAPFPRRALPSSLLRSTPINSPLLFDSPADPFQVLIPSISSSSSGSLPFAPNDENAPPTRQTMFLETAPTEDNKLAVIAESVVEFSPLNSDDIVSMSPDRDSRTVDFTHALNSAHVPISEYVPTIPPSSARNSVDAHGIHTENGTENGVISNRTGSKRRGKESWNPIAKASAVGKILQVEDRKKKNGVGSSARGEEEEAELEDDPIEVD
ncbi:uncharacterized protein JCM6883_003019 [Sporobolomyces salmoneus]|uniref:uncharacterized protein n=1 Tax=Sporobolomyces salmoneus TaxID=183962 RepID=UPI00317826F6